MKYFFFCLLLSGLLSCRSYSDRIGVVSEQPIVPVLTLKDHNPVLKLELVKRDLPACRVEEVVLSLEGTTDVRDIESVTLFAAGKKGAFSGKTPLSDPQPPARQMSFKGPIEFESDTLACWVSVKLKERVDLSHRIGVACTEIATSDGSVVVPETAARPGLRTGVALRQRGQDGVNTSRIPGLTTSKKGTLLAVYDARYENSRDLQGHIDIGLNRSTDGGQTWQPMQIVLDMKEWGGLPEKYNGVSDACILADDRTGDLYVAGLWMHGVLDGRSGRWVKGLTADSTRWIHQWHSKGSQPGLGVKETSQFIIAKSSDDGLTWSDPVNITPQTKRKAWWLYAPAPGHGITLLDGTLVFPTQGRDENGLPFSNLTYSTDGGQSWTASLPAYSDVTECMAAQLPDGSIMLNMRDNRNRRDKEVNGRRICVTADLGETWTEHATSRKALIEPVCMGSLHRHIYRQGETEKSILLFCNPDSKTNRDHMTVKVSFDNGNSWPDDKKIVLDERGGFGYSCLTSVNDSVIGVLYEGSQAQMVFQQIRLNELTGE